jgi:hypothetical protein
VAAALRRFATLVGALVAGTAALSLLIGLAFGSGVSRSLALGWYIVGSVLLISGFFVGNRGPARPRGEGWNVFSINRWTRWATPDEQFESLSLSAVLVIVGLLLIALGVVADARYPLV